MKKETEETLLDEEKCGSCSKVIKFHDLQMTNLINFHYLQMTNLNVVLHCSERLLTVQ